MYTTVQKLAVSHFEKLIIMSIEGTSKVWKKKLINKGKKHAMCCNMPCLAVSGKPVIIAQNVCWMSGPCLCSEELLALHVSSPHRR